MRNYKLQFERIISDKLGDYSQYTLRRDGVEIASLTTFHDGVWRLYCHESSKIMYKKITVLNVFRQYIAMKKLVTDKISRSEFDKLVAA